MTAAARIGRDDLFQSSRLEQVFADCFADSERTRLLGGAREPLYVPAGEVQEDRVEDWHRLYYREDYFASALHEVSHWCIAGRERRRQRDFGYWYAPDGRGPEQQAAFQAVEVKPQALEWCFAQACGFPFQVSLDNLDGGDEARASEAAFRAAVIERANWLREHGLPPRAQQFFDALARTFATGTTVASLEFTFGEPT